MMDDDPRKSADTEATSEAPAPKKPQTGLETPAEIGGPEGPEPTRFGDWERNGRCYDF